ncbi:PTS glucitol/sorbitol transporter subunit IIA [Actinobacillus succinogenes]|uniref:PTS system glucitol/sorbitol-specific IIA component n=1 Tax=Actinobacillus succinogenes (strain ATCC 55618 / DSM 22257 / CCUG 43843 / 130Z) TaxID=339671 RepID=A6VLG6_ACTSZ|nr:PTS glucitol/sorbitol transporter subunit IIA [Actinobacillus succinogenes]ABR73813.1 PTS system glucitol/sorbitol-specific IIA component [Actinobacillus succinogenes 130Z]PHI39733.1 PTS glucitol/sorbitol transporter subunit IIA [Actinobacillus succinogenes]
MTVIYQTTFTKVGNFARDALEEGMLITFKQGAPADLEDYCFIHSHGVLDTDIRQGDIAEFDGVDYPVTAVGEVASFNLKELGHVTWRFDGAEHAEYPGTIHVRGTIPSAVKEGSVLRIKRGE